MFSSLTLTISFFVSFTDSDSIILNDVGSLSCHCVTFCREMSFGISIVNIGAITK